MDQVLADTLKANLKSAETPEAITQAQTLAMIAVVDCQFKTSERVKVLVAVEVYSNEVDGTVWRYKVPWNRPNPKAEVVRANAKLPKPVITNGIPARLAAARLRRQAEKETVSNVTERVTVNLPGVQ